MSARLTVFCRLPAPKLGAVEARAVLDAIEDWYALAESFAIDDEAAIDAARAALALEDAGDGVAIRYRAPALRPLEVAVSRDEAFVRATCSEARERVDTVQELGAREVFAHLDATRAVVSIELGWGQLEDVGVVIANALAEHVAKKHDGLIEDQNGDWWTLTDDGTPRVVVGPAWR